MDIDEVISRIEDHMVVHKMRESPNAVHITKALESAINFLKEHRWHDLRKNPNDLPEDCAINQDGKRVMYDSTNKVWRNDDADEYICDDPIAWCEIPMFES